MNISPEASLVLLLIVVTVGATVFLADLIIFIRWISYRWAKYDIEERRYRLAEQVAAQGAAAVQEGTPPAEAYEAPEPPYIPEPDYPFARTWSLVDPFLVFQAVFIGIQVLIGVAMLPLMISKAGLNASAVFSIPGVIIQLIGLVLMNALLVTGVAFCVRRYGLKMADIGLGKPLPGQIGLGIAIGLVVFVCITGSEIGMGLLLPKLIPKPILDSLTEFTKAVTAGGMFGELKSVPIKIAFTLVGAIAAPIGEEVFFRGLLYNSLKRRLNVPAAIVLSGLMFALIHIGPLAILLIFPMGMFLAYVYEKTKSLWVTIAIHATHNGLSFVAAMLLPQLGETPKEPVKPIVPPTKPAIVFQAPTHPSREVEPRISGVAFYG